MIKLDVLYLLTYLNTAEVKSWTKNHKKALLSFIFNNFNLMISVSENRHGLVDTCFLVEKDLLYFLKNRSDGKFSIENLHVAMRDNKCTITCYKSSTEGHWDLFLSLKFILKVRYPTVTIEYFNQSKLETQKGPKALLFLGFLPNKLRPIILKERAAELETMDDLHNYLIDNCLDDLNFESLFTFTQKLERLFSKNMVHIPNFEFKKFDFEGINSSLRAFFLPFDTAIFNRDELYFYKKVVDMSVNHTRALDIWRGWDNKVSLSKRSQQGHIDIRALTRYNLEDYNYAVYKCLDFSHKYTFYVKFKYDKFSILLELVDPLLNLETLKSLIFKVSSFGKIFYNIQKLKITGYGSSDNVSVTIISLSDRPDLSKLALDIQNKPKKIIIFEECIIFSKELTN